MHVFSISKKEIKTYEVGFTFPEAMGFYHVENGFYLGGGLEGSFPNYQFSSHFRKLKPNGEVALLQKMPIAKSNFTMTHWRQKNKLFTLGGHNGSALK